MAVRDELAGGCPRICETQMIADIVQPRFQNLQHLFAGDAAALQGALIHAPELTLQKPVVIPEFLFLDQAQAVVGVFGAPLRAVNAGAVAAALEILRGPEDGDAESAADANAGTGVTCHEIYDF